MKKTTKIIIIAILVLTIAGIWAYKTFNKDKVHLNNTVTNGQKLPVLLELSSDTCTPCRLMVPVLNDISKIYDDKVTVKIVNIYDNPEEGEKYSIRVIPTQVFFDKDGNEVFRHEGYFSKEEIIKVFDAMGVK